MLPSCVWLHADLMCQQKMGGRSSGHGLIPACISLGTLSSTSLINYWSVPVTNYIHVAPSLVTSYVMGQSRTHENRDASRMTYG
jgi:hypothetical protein